MPDLGLLGRQPTRGRTGRRRRGPARGGAVHAAGCRADPDGPAAANAAGADVQNPLFWTLFWTTSGVSSRATAVQYAKNT